MKYDDVAEKVSAWAGLEVDDAFGYAVTYAKEIRARKGDRISIEQVAAALSVLNQAYRELVEISVSPTASEGPAHLVREESELYVRHKLDLETELTNYGEMIDDTCDPIEARMMERLREERRKAIQKLLLDQLIRDLNAEWEPNPDCTVSVGKMSINYNLGTGKTSVTGKWKWLKKSFPDGDGGAGDFSVDRVGKVDFKNGKPVAVSGGVEATVGYGPFSGKGSATVGVQWNEGTQQYDFPVEMSAKPSIGYKKKTQFGDLGISCSPGKAKMKFDARVVSKSAMNYVKSL